LKVIAYAFGDYEGKLGKATVQGAETIVQVLARREVELTYLTSPYHQNLNSIFKLRFCSRGIKTKIFIIIKEDKDENLFV
jgi:hypothetical protein